MGNVKTSDPCITERIGPVLVGMSLQLLTTVPWECYDEAISIKQSPPLFLTNSPTKRGFHQYSTTKTDVGSNKNTEIEDNHQRDGIDTSQEKQGLGPEVWVIESATVGNPPANSRITIWPDGRMNQVSPMKSGR